MKQTAHIKEKQDVVFSSIANILSGISAPVRIRLIHFLSQAPLTVEVLSNKIGQSVANTSMHLRKMFAEKLVTVEVIGQKRLYTLHPAMLNFWEQIQDFVQKVDEDLDLKLDDLNWVSSMEETIEMFKSGKVFILDVRPEDEVGETLDCHHYLHISEREISKSINMLPKRKPVLVICRGRFCVLSANVVLELRELGIKAYRLEHSFYQIKSKLNK